MMKMLPPARPCVPSRAALGLGALLLCVGCATMGPQSRPPGESELRRLEEQVARDSSDAGALVALGSAYHRLGRFPEARDLLEQAVARQPRDAEAGALLGLAYEDLGLYAQAMERYRSYLQMGRNASLKRQLSGRVLVLRRRELAAAARDALAREAELSATAPQRGTVAVFPFLIQSENPELQPLGRALAELLVTDLSQTDRLRVLERLQVQTLLDEIRLAETGLVDPATAARSGRLLGAEHVVQGSVSGSEAALQLRAAVVGVGAPAAPQPAAVQEQDALNRLFDMEKRLALEIYRSLGIELTAAERERVNRRPTENVQALLAYGFGLTAEDAGDFARAQQFYARAASLDPGFSAAHQRAQSAARAVQAASVSTGAVAALAATADPSGGLAEAEALVPGSGGRDAVTELLGQEGLGRQGGVIRILLSGGSRD